MCERTIERAIAGEDCVWALLGGERGNAGGVNGNRQS